MPILTIRSSNPLKDGRQSEHALMIQQGVMRHFRQYDIIMMAELTLANNMRADLIGVDAKGVISIIEIKSSVEDFKADQKWPNYTKFCDRFYFASHGDVPGHIFPEEEGFVLADGYGAEIIRPAIENKLPAATRKALTLRIARAASSRLGRIIRFADSSGIKIPADDSKTDE